MRWTSYIRGTSDTEHREDARQGEKDGRRADQEGRDRPAEPLEPVQDAREMD
jgi:hypothetical protein